MTGINKPYGEQLKVAIFGGNPGYIDQSAADDDRKTYPGGITPGGPGAARATDHRAAKDGTRITDRQAAIPPGP